MGLIQGVCVPAHLYHFNGKAAVDGARKEGEARCTEVVGHGGSRLQLYSVGRLKKGPPQSWGWGGGCLVAASLCAVLNKYTTAIVRVGVTRYHFCLSVLCLGWM